MLATDARAFIKKIKKATHPFAQLEYAKDAKETYDDMGTYNIVSFRQYRGSQYRFGLKTKVEKELSLVHVKPKAETSENHIKQSIDAELLMREKAVPEDFNHYSLYYDKRGHRISVRSERGSLHQFIEANRTRFSLDLVREMIGQIILAVYDNHIRNVVHRDIKPENFLVFFRNGKFIIKLTDHDRAFETYDSGKPLTVHDDIFGSGKFMSPELLQIDTELEKIASESDLLKMAAVDKSTIENEKKIDCDQRSQGLLKKHADLNFKAIDCWALGLAIFEMNDLLPPASRLKPEFMVLCNSLKQNDLAKRKTIEDVMQLPFFGSTPQKREKFFAQLRARAKENILIIDGYAQCPVEPKDPFFMLDSKIRPLYCAGARALVIAEKIDECQRGIDSEFKNVSFSNIVKQFESLKQNTAQLVSVTTTDERYKDDFLALKQEASKQTQDILLKPFKEKRVIAALLKKAVDEAYQEFLTLNKLNKLEENEDKATKHDFNIFHGVPGFKHARTFKNQINQAFQADPDPKAIFALIHDHYHHGEGKKHPHSFKTLLQNMLYLLSDKSIDEWKKYFDKMDVSAKTLTNSPSRST